MSVHELPFPTLPRHRAAPHQQEKTQISTTNFKTRKTLEKTERVKIKARKRDGMKERNKKSIWFSVTHRIPVHVYTTTAMDKGGTARKGKKKH